MRIAEWLAGHKAKLIVADIDPAKPRYAQEHWQAEISSTEDILSRECQVLVPCGLGAIINEQSVTQLQCQAIVGAANNQLANQQIDQILLDRGICYAPDFIVNAGGLMQVVLSRSGAEENTILQKLNNIPQTLAHIFEQQQQTGKGFQELAIALAKSRIVAP